MNKITLIAIASAAWSIQLNAGKWSWLTEASKLTGPAIRAGIKANNELEKETKKREYAEGKLKEGLSLLAKSDHSGDDIKKAIACFIEADRNGHKMAAGITAFSYFLINDEQSSVVWAKKAESQEDPLGCNIVAAMTIWGQPGWGCSKEKAGEYLKKHEANDDAFSNLGIGICMLNGECGFEKNENKGFALIKRASDNELSCAKYTLTWLYISGTGCVKSHKKALDVANSLASSGNARGFYLSALILCEGEGIEHDYEEAYCRFIVAKQCGMNLSECGAKETFESLEAKLSEQQKENARSKANKICGH